MKRRISITRTIDVLSYYLTLAKKELKTPFRISLKKRFEMWRGGFLGESHVIYDFENNDPGYYINDVKRLTSTMRINGLYKDILDNKLIFYEMLKDFNLPVLIGLLINGSFFSAEDKKFYNDVRPTISGLLQKWGGLVLKPIDGGGGSGILIMKLEDDNLFINGKASTRADWEKISSLNNYMVTEFVKQSETQTRFYPPTTNTLRILTIWDPENNKPFIAVAIQRIGNDTSFPVDNWTQGGLSCLIDLDTGIIGPGATYPKTGKLIWHDVHPVSGAVLKGTKIPHWETIRSDILNVVAALPFLPYIGWDIVVTDEGYRIIEGNGHTDVNLLQVHYPLLKNPSTRSFYSKYDCI